MIRTAWICLLLLVAGALAGCQALSGLELVTLTPDPTAGPSSTPSPTATATATSTPTPTATATPIPHEVFTGVIMGGDFDARRPERNRFGVRADTFLIYVFDYWPTLPERNGVTLISLPRDLWLEVPCSPLDPALEGRDRVNAAWAYGQFDCVQETVEANFDLEINAPMAFTDFDGFLWLVGRLGAVKITPTRSYSDWCGSYHGTDGDHGRTVFWQAGLTYSMGPAEALCYVRARANSNDLNRNGRTLEMAEALGVQYASYLFGEDHRSVGPGIMAAEIANFMLDGRRYIDLSLPLDDVLNFVTVLPEALEAPRRTLRLGLEEVSFYTTPIYGASVLLPRVDLRAWLNCMMASWEISLLEGVPDCTISHRLPEG